MAVLLSTYRDRVKLHENGYLYVFDKMSSNGEKKFWRCERKNECNARVHTDAITNQVVKRSSVHNHPSNPYIVQKCGIRILANRRSKESVGEAKSSFDQKVSVAEEPPEQQPKVSLSNNEILDSILQQTQRSLTDENGISSVSFNDEEAAPSKKRRKGTAKGTYRESGKRLSSCNDQNGFVSSSNSEGTNIKGTNANEINGCISPEDAEEFLFSNITVPPQLPLRKLVGRNSSEYSCIEKFLNAKLISWCPKISEIIDLGRMIVNMVSHSGTETCTSLLLAGIANSGKTYLAALIAKQSEISALKFCSPNDFVGFTEAAKVLALCKIFEEAYKNDISIIFLDNVDRLIDYCAINNQFSNTVLQTLYVLLKKIPPPGHRVFVIATSENNCAKMFELKTQFSFFVDVPPLTEVNHLMAVIEESHVLDLSQMESLRQLLEKSSLKFSFGMKRLLDILELSKQCDDSQRALFLYKKLKDFTSL